MGLSGLEPPTSRLSGGCSNQLSYKPVDLPAVSDSGGDDGIRTHDPLLAGQVLSQLSYTPVRGGGFWQTASDADPLISPRRCTSYSERTRSRGEKALESRWKKSEGFYPLSSFRKRTVFQLFHSLFVLFRSALKTTAKMSAPTYLPVLLPAKYFRLSGA